MVVSLLRERMDRVAAAHRKMLQGDGVLRDLEFAMLAKGGMSPEDELKFRIRSFVPRAGFILGSTFGCFLWSIGIDIGATLARHPLMYGLKKFGFVLGLGYLMGNAMVLPTERAWVSMILKCEDEHVKMELANIILTYHSDDEPLVQIVKTHFFSEQMFDDLHEDKPFLRWHPRCSYVDDAFVERMKEIEASNSDDEARSISMQTTLNRSFADLMEDPFACILGAPGGDIERNTHPVKAGTVLKRSELRTCRRSHRHHHHRHADKLTASAC